MAEDIDKFAGNRTIKTSGFLNHIDMRLTADQHADFLSKMYDFAKWAFFVQFDDSPDMLYVFTLVTVRR
jgi:hypothetical protein